MYEVSDYGPYEYDPRTRHLATHKNTIVYDVQTFNVRSGAYPNWVSGVPRTPNLKI